MKRLLVLLAVIAASAAVAACSAPANQPCLYDGGLRYSHLSYSGHELLVVCHDGKIIARHL